MTVAIKFAMNHHVDARGDGRENKCGINVAAGQERERAEFSEGVLSAVGVDRAGSGQSAVEGDEEIEALCLPYLADDETVGPHPEGLFDEAPQRDFTRPLQAWLATLHRDDITGNEAELKRFFNGDNSFIGSRR
jgi:hypothetical protein